jgi:TonB family protein
VPNSHLLKNWIALSVLVHLTVLMLASMIPLAPPRPPDVMVVDLADLPRSINFPRPQPGIVEGAPPKPPAPAPPKPVRREEPPLPPPSELTGRVPDLPVNPDLPPEKEFPAPRPRKETVPPAGSEEPQVARPEERSRDTAPPSPAPSEPPSSPEPKSLRDITPSLGKMVMAKVEPGAGRGEGTSSGNAVGTGGKAVEKGAITEEHGGGAHLTALNAPEVQYISYFASIKRKIELIWQYPQEAAAAGLQGDLIVDFVIGRSGKLESVELLQGSGHKVLDDEALDSIRKASPYNPIPDAYKIPNLTIRAHFIYEMHSLRIR